MEKILRYLKLTLPYLTLAEITLRQIDSNDTGFDDETADKLKEAVHFLNSFIQANEENQTTVAKGYTQIVAFGESVLGALHELKTSELSDSEKLDKANELVLMLSDSSKVYQAQRGKDAEALSAYKLEARKLANQITE